jgi:hypothetical protein
MKKRLPILLFAFVAALTSCKKDVDAGGDASALYGDWKFTGLKAKTVADVSTTAGGATDRAVTTTQYTSINNSGVIRFSAGKAETTELGYTTQGSAIVKIYSGGTTDEFTTPFNYTVPKTSSSSSFNAVGSDSLYFSGGGMVKMPGSTGEVVPSAPGGAKYSIAGTKLTMTIQASAVTNQTAQGMTVKSTVSVNSEMTFEKQ